MRWPAPSSLLGICSTVGVCAVTGCGPAADSGRGLVVRTAVCQTFCIDSDLEGNLKRMEYAVATAAAHGAVLACLPECADLGWVNPDAHTLAGPIPGPTSDRIGAMARKHGLMISVGLCEKEGDQLYDSAILVGSDGAILARHRKINTLRELLTPPYTRGRAEDIQVVETPIGRVGLLICADTFREDLVNRVAAQSPDLLIVPYGWAAPKEKWPDHAKSLAGVVSGAAKRAGCAVVGTDVVGSITHGPWTGQTYGGQSVVADRAGNIIATLRDRDAEVRIVEVPVGRQ